jgi:hypothetical protein
MATDTSEEITIELYGTKDKLILLFTVAFASLLLVMHIIHQQPAAAAVSFRSVFTLRNVTVFRKTTTNNQQIIIIIRPPHQPL